MRKQNDFSKSRKNLFAFLLTATTAICMLGSLHAEPLKEYLWKRRVVLSFSADKSTPERISLLKQIEQYQCEFDDRQMVHIDLIAGSSDHQLLSRQFSVPNTNFNLLLLGKDGGVKLLTSQPSLENVLTLIDTMPMRQRELRIGSCP
jgi:hypothetical protein